MSRFFIAMTIAGMLLPGCVLRHPTDPYAPVSHLTVTPLNHPATPSAVKSQPASIQGPLTLEHAIQIALANNPEIAAMKWDVSGTGSRLNAARSARWPTLSAEGAYHYFLDDQRLIPARYNGEPGIFDNNFYRADLVLKLPLFTGGRITNEIRVAELLKQSAEDRWGRTREELVFNVSSTFYSILGQREVIRSLEFSASAMEEHRKRVSDLLAVEKAARVDLLRTEVRLANLRQSLVQEKNVFAIEKHLLADLLGVDYAINSFSIEGALTIESLPVMPAAKLVSAAFERRSDYLAAKASLEAQARRVDAAMAGHWPTVWLLGGYGVRVAGSGESGDAGTIGGVVSVPLFEGGRTVAQVNQERAGLGAAQERLRKLELQIRREVETAVLDIQSSDERINATRQSIEQAKESLRIERMKYDLSSGSMTDVLDAQSSLLQSETNYARAMADFRIAKARLKLVTGENLL